MADYTVILNFNDGTKNYDFPLVQSISDPIEGIKATVIEGTRGNGSIVIPGGKKSAEIEIKGILADNDGYADLMDKVNTMKSDVTTNVATLTLKHWTGAIWENDWQYNVRRIDEILFGESLRTYEIPYTVRFLILSY